MIDLKDLEALLALREDIHASVRIGFENVNDLCRTTDVGESLFFGANNAEWSLLAQAFTNHFFVTRLEDVQRQRRARKQNQVERKQRKERVHDLEIVRCA